MSLTLLEAAKLSQTPLQRGVIEVFPRTSAVLERLPFLDVASDSYKYNQEEALPGIPLPPLRKGGSYKLPPLGKGSEGDFSTGAGK